MPQAYRRHDPDDYDEGLGCATCGVIIATMIVIGGVICFLLLKAYGLI